MSINYIYVIQVELYTHHESMNSISTKLTENLLKLCSVNLIDSHHCSDPGKIFYYLTVFFYFEDNFQK